MAEETQEGVVSPVKCYPFQPQKADSSFNVTNRSGNLLIFVSQNPTIFYS